MGFMKRWDVDNISSQIHTISRECSSSSNDGFTAWGCKQDLYTLKSLIDSALSKSPTFGDMEEQWLKEQEQKRIINILKKE